MNTPEEKGAGPDALARIAVLISGSGSNLQAIIDACDAGDIPARVVVVASNRGQAYGLQRAQRVGIPTIYHPLRPYKQDGRGRQAYDADLADRLAPYRPDWIALAGWMHVLGDSFLRRYAGRVINLHPALPGQFPGVDAIARAYAAFQCDGKTQAGVMLHFVPDEGVDVGPVIRSEAVPIRPGETLDQLIARVHSAEHRNYVAALRQLIEGRYPEQQVHRKG